MISNLIIGQHKFVLFVDKVGMEPESGKIIKKWLNEQNRNSYYIIPTEFEEDLDFTIKANSAEYPKFNAGTDIILQPLAHLLLTYNAATVFQLVNQLKKNANVKQIFLWATVKNVSEHFVVPFLKYMSDMVVAFSDYTNVSILTRKTGGLVTNKNYSFDVENGIFHVKEITKNAQPKVEPAVNPETLGTFKINLDEEELIARNAMKLPYERDQQKEGKIVYTPDADDDFDDEDPDEDLYI